MADTGSETKERKRQREREREKKCKSMPYGSKIKNKVTSLRVTPDGLHVSVSLCRLKSARSCGVNLLGDVLEGRARSSLCVLQWP